VVRDRESRVGWRRGTCVFAADVLITEVAGENAGALWPGPVEAERRVRVIQ